MAVEVDGDIELTRFVHPKKTIYLFGGENRFLPKIGDYRVKIDTKYCLNMATTASIVAYDRYCKFHK